METIERIVAGESASPNEENIDRALRPTRLADYVGQPKACEQLSIFIEAAKARKEALDHLLIFGPPGLGKTTLAHIIANEMGVNLRQTSGPVLERPGDLAAILTNLQQNDVLFIDEIHRLSPVVEEILYPALEDFQIDIMIGEGPAARSIKLDLKPFTLIGATTRAGMLTNPLRARFGIVSQLQFYETADLAKIVKRSARKGELHDACIVHKHLKGVALFDAEHDIRVKRDPLFGGDAVFLKGHLGAGLGQVEGEVIPFLLLRRVAELGVIGHIVECAGNGPVRLDGQIIAHQLRDLLPQQGLTCGEKR